MKKNIFIKLLTLVLILTISTFSTTTAFAYFGPTNNQSDVLTTYAGEVTIPDDVDEATFEAGNKLIVTIPGADLSAVAAEGDIYNGRERLFITNFSVDNDAKTVTFEFMNQIWAGTTLNFAFYNASSPYGTHTYKVELYSAGNETTTEIESGEYTVLDNGLQVKLTVGQYLNFGLTVNTADPMDVKLNFTDNRAIIEHSIGWHIATNAQEYNVSAKLKTEFKNGEHLFPYSIPAEMGDYIPEEDIKHVAGVFMGNFAPPDARANEALKGYYTPLKTTESILLTTGSGTDGDYNSVLISFNANGSTPAGTYIGIVEFTVTATF